ncbi:LOW QUALITY PROTEIN: TBC1 domain family member 5 [Lampetra fluviatilis]
MQSRDNGGSSCEARHTQPEHGEWSSGQSWHPLQSERGEEVGGPCLESDVENNTADSYRQEWVRMFDDQEHVSRVRQRGMKGQLRSSRFRSVCWKMYLKCLPDDRELWVKITEELRQQYDQIKLMHITNPRKEAGEKDLNINNPLSQAEESPWNRFFQDKELRAVIEQDVTRTFPEIQYFQEERVQELLTDILFCFARENEHLLYRQGMHELLAPIVFVLHCDYQAFLHATELSQATNEMRTILNPEYLEHDAYALFSQLMETAEPWFSNSERKKYMGRDPTVNAVPFARPQDNSPSIAIITKLNRINDQVLKQHDTELYMHLLRLEIAPQIYGIRWVRLLFGREFPLQDLLALWDAIFADSANLSLVDYMFVAMLQNIRDPLLSSNYQTCLGLLMHYPPSGDLHHLVQKALFLRDPKNNPRPNNYKFSGTVETPKASAIVRHTEYAARETQQRPAVNINKVSAGLLNLTRKLIGPPASGQATSVVPRARLMTDTSVRVHQQQEQQQQHRILKSESVPSHLSKGKVEAGNGEKAPLPADSMAGGTGLGWGEGNSSPSTESLSREEPRPLPSSPAGTRGKALFGSGSTLPRPRSVSKTRRELEEDLQSQISLLQAKLIEMQGMCHYCAEKLDQHLAKIQEDILQENLQREDEILVSLAGIKQIKDILKGTLRFNQSQLESGDNEEISITDNHYQPDGSQAAGPGSKVAKVSVPHRTAEDPSLGLQSPRPIRQNLPMDNPLMEIRQARKSTLQEIAYGIECSDEGGHAALSSDGGNGSSMQKHPIAESQHPLGDGQTLQGDDHHTAGPVRSLISPDEESGSNTSRDSTLIVSPLDL